MGKKNWSITHYRAAETELGERPKVKISAFCDPYDANADFAGIIVYAVKDSFKWTKTETVTGWGGRFAYVMIKDTGKFSKSELNQVGQGRVHDAMFRKVMKGEFGDNIVSCGGFAVMKGTTKYSSIWLNFQINTSFAESDWNQMLSEPEKALVDFAVAGWKRSGSNVLLPIDDSLHAKLSGMPLSVPSTVSVASTSPPVYQQPESTVSVVRKLICRWCCCRFSRSPEEVLL